MLDQGRLAKVMFALLAAMIGGAFLLLALEGKPIKPMAFSLSSQTQLTTAYDALDTKTTLNGSRWNRIEVCCRPNDGQLTARHGLTGDLALKFHFVIADAAAGDDGAVFTSPRWTHQRATINCPPERTKTIRICLIGNPTNPLRTSAQARSLDQLLNSLVRHCDIKSRVVWTD